MSNSDELNDSKPRLSRKQAIEQLWELGNLEYLLKGKQKDLKLHLKNTTETISVVLCSRRFGKSHCLCSWAIETCIKIPGAIVKYACPQKEMVRTIINPIMNNILKDCPAHLMPEWKEKRQVWLFPNGSEIQIAGTDKGNVEFLRGGKADLAICDEAGFMDGLSNVVYSVLAPTVDTTGGKVVLSSTPNPQEPQHDFHTMFIAPREDEGRLVKFTLHDSPMVSKEKIQEIISRYPGGESNAQFRCEYLCEVITQREAMVIPELTPEVQLAIVQENPRPAYCDYYTSADPAFVDLTGVLFSYYDFKRASLIIEDELVMNGEEMTTDSLAKAIADKEKQNYKHPVTHMSSEPFMRVIDNNNLILVNDLHRLHSLTFIPTKKDNKEAQINQLRMMISEGRIIINPRCRNLVYQLKNAKWDKQHKGFLRIKDSSDGQLRGGHADLLDALLYLVRNIVQAKNPYPYGYGELSGPGVFTTQTGSKNGFTDLMKNMFNMKDK